ncbi:MAG: shikimate dehydrogenase [Christensenellaceae bacterium]|nr:shikimate dehydrogenase [Christensenellaceae bacterium]
MRVLADSDTQLIFQIGDPLDFSCGAAVHNAVFEYANLNAICLSLTVKKGELGPFCQAVKTLGICGFDVTMPHKSDVIEFCDEVDELSRAFNCVNHVDLRDGKLVGTALDGVGMCLNMLGAGIEIEGKRVMLLGAGGVAGPIAAECCKRGATAIRIANRTVDKAKSICGVIDEYFSVETEFGSMDMDTLNDFASRSDIIVQCTCLGMAGSGMDYEDVSFVSKMPQGGAVADVLYNPDKTKILTYAEQQGYKIVNGLGMMINQQKAMLKFHLDYDLETDCSDYAEEGLLVAVAQRQARAKRLARQKAKLQGEKKE